MTMVDLNDILSSATVMIVSVTGSTTQGQPLSETDLSQCLRACDEVLTLMEDKAVILKYVESRMSHLAPNLTACIGMCVHLYICINYSNFIYCIFMLQHSTVIHDLISVMPW
jgi:U4/U6 small nuclear ribonucleoprotein PRP31